MEDANHQQDDGIDINNDKDNDNNEEESYIEEDSEDDEDEEVDLDKDIFETLKQNDPTVTDLQVVLNCYFNGDKSFFHDIDWKEHGYFIANNTQLKRIHIFYRISTSVSICRSNYILGEEEELNLPTRQQLQDFFSCIYQNRSTKVLGFSSIGINDEFGRSLIEGLSGHPSLERLEIDNGRLGEASGGAVQ